VSASDLGRPVVYGDAERVVVMVESVTRMVLHQPVEVLTDPVVNGSLRRLHDATCHWLQDDARDDQTSGRHTQAAERQAP
jgi:hypothetical protein